MSAFRRWFESVGIAAAVTLVAGAVVLAAHAIQGPDVKVTGDNANGNFGTPTPSFDAWNLWASTTTVAINPLAANIVAAAATDYRMAPVFGDGWVSLYVSSDNGAAWFNTMVPGFPSDTSPAGTASPLLGLDVAATATVRFDAQGNLYVSGEAWKRSFRPGQSGADVVVFVATYDYTPGTPAGASTPSAAGNPANYTYARTTVVDRGTVGFAIPGQVGFAGTFTDTSRIAIDRSAPTASRCAGTIYETHANIHGGNAAGSEPTVFSRSTDGGATFSPPRAISTGGKGGTPDTTTPSMAVASDGTIYVAFHASERSTGTNTINVVRSNDCGGHWSQPVVVGGGLRALCFAVVAVDDTNPDVVYVGYWDLDDDFDIYVQRSLNGGVTWGPRVRVNTDPGQHDQTRPTIDVSNGTLHVAWNDFRNSAAGANDILDVYYACSNCNGRNYPNFDDETRVTDISSNSACLVFGPSPLFDIYIELAARWDGVENVVHVVWGDNRDVSPCDLDPSPGPPPDGQGSRSRNIYGDTLRVTP